MEAVPSCPTLFTHDEKLGRIIAAGCARQSMAERSDAHGGIRGIRRLTGRLIDPIGTWLPCSRRIRAR